MWAGGAGEGVPEKQSRADPGLGAQRLCLNFLDFRFQFLLVVIGVSVHCWDGHVRAWCVWYWDQIRLRGRRWDAFGEG